MPLRMTAHFLSPRILGNSQLRHRAAVSPRPNDGPAIMSCYEERTAPNHVMNGIHTETTNVRASCEHSIHLPRQANPSSRCERIPCIKSIRL